MEALADSLTIPLKGLPKGENHFSFAIGGEFFQKFGNTRIKDADCSVKATVLRHGTMVTVDCMTVGFVTVECDRCLEDLTLKVDVERTLTVGFGSLDVNGASDEDDVMVVPSADSELSLDQFVYDYVCLSLPLVMVHPEGKCNPDMIARMGKAGTSEEDENESPFGKLKEMLKK